MTRRNFSLSWGRKIFFGISWPLSMLLTLVHLRSYIFPVSFTEWFYYLLTLIGNLGIFNAVVYFLIYCPVILIFPTYYITRIWSVLLIMALNLFVLSDSISFSSYHLHIYSFLSKFYLTEGVEYLIGSRIILIVLSALVFILPVAIWIRGELLWRAMQKRFSNPVSNWYLILILLFLILSKLLYRFGEIHSNLAYQFPLNFNFENPSKIYSENRKLYYPQGIDKCKGKQNPNMVLLIINEDMNVFQGLDGLPSTSHLLKHGMSYNQHYRTGIDKNDDLFTLFYSLPASYKSSTDKVKPAIYDVLESRRYEIIEINHQNGKVLGRENDETLKEKFKGWITEHNLNREKPYFVSLVLNNDIFEADKNVYDFVIELQKNSLLLNTHLIVIGISGKKTTVPFVWINPERKIKAINHPTSQYDVMPTVMDKIWGCHKAYKSSGGGLDLDLDEREWLLMSNQNEFRIKRLRDGGEISVKDNSVKETGATMRKGLIFEALRLMTKFYRNF